jgi:hypothetical protein
MQQSLGNKIHRVSADIKTHQAAYSTKGSFLFYLLSVSFGFHRSVSTLLEAGFGEHEIRHRVEILYSYLIKYVKVGHSRTSFPHSQLRVDKA